MQPPFVPSLFVEFRKKLTEEILGAINDMILDYNVPDDSDDDDPSGFHERGSEDQN
jgi:transposase IS4 family protein